MSMVLKNIGSIVGFSSGSYATNTIYLKDGRICAESDVQQGDAPRIVDCGGLTLMPGFVDLHGSLPTVAKDSEAAVRGGFTTVVQTVGAHHAPHDISSYLSTKQQFEHAKCSVVVPGALTCGLEGERLSEMGRMAQAGAQIMSHGASLVQSTQVLWRTFEYAERLGLRVFVRPGEYPLEQHAVARLSDWSVVHGLPGVIAESEEIGVYRVAALARQSGVSVHLTHLSTKRGVDAVRTVRRENPLITASTTIHHIALSQDRLPAYDGNSRFTPPLGTRNDCDALRAGLREGVLQAVASDHLPHPPRNKRCEFETAASGAIGFEFSLPGSLQALGSVDAAMSALSLGPRNVLGLPRPTLALGTSPDMVLVAPNEQWMLTKSNCAASESNSPILGETLFGRVKMTWVCGDLAFDACVNREM